MAQFYLPKIGDGSGGTVILGSYQLATAPVNENAEILDCLGRRVNTVATRTRKLFIAADQENQRWTFSDSPIAYPAADVTDLPAGGGGPHAVTHENGGIDEIDLSALSGLLADPQAPLSHTHIIADTTGLQTVLDGKSGVGHTHVIADVGSLQSSLDGKAALVHTHAIADTTGLQTSLDGKAALVHTHAQSDVTGLVTALAGKSAVGHTHDATEVISGVLAIARIPTGTSASTVTVGNDARLSDARTPSAHGSTHKSGGTDAIKLDELAAPTDVTTLNVSTSAHGLAPKLPNVATQYLDGTGAFSTPAGKTQVLANANTADVVATSVDTYLTGSSVPIAGNIKQKTIFKWRFRMTKTALGVAAPIWSIRVGTAGSTADTARLTLTGVAQTAVADDGWCEIEVIVRTFSTTGVIEGVLQMTHTLTTTGLQTVSIKTLQAVSSTFDITAASLQIGVSCNPGSSAVWTFQHASVEAINLA